MQRRLMLIALAVSLPGIVRGLMPPHVTRSEPPDGGVLYGSTLVFRGYTLASGTDAAIITDGRGQKIPVTQTVTCEYVGEGDCPGCRQEQCEIVVRMSTIVPGATYRASLLEYSITFTAASDRAAGKPTPDR